jgi:hypothetical protein
VKYVATFYSCHTSAFLQEWSSIQRAEHYIIVGSLLKDAKRYSMFKLVIAGINVWFWSTIPTAFCQ